MNGRYIILAAAAAALASAGGCVERRVTITSQPEGALVFFADEEIGRTPLTIPFLFYGDREVILRKQGYQTLQTHADLKPPVYDVPPFDLFSQALVPWTYHYHVHEHYVMSPQELPEESGLIERADQLKGEVPAK
jgi:hypothetical protein